jgi:transposase
MPLRTCLAHVRGWLLRRPPPLGPVPMETARLAHAAWPKGARDLRRADALDTLCTDARCADRFPPSGQPALAPGRRGPVTRLPRAEGRAARHGAEAVRRRIAWPYVLCVALAAPGVDAAGLSACRTCLGAGAAAYLLVETVLTRWRARHLVHAGAAGRPRSGHRRAHPGVEQWGDGRPDPSPEVAQAPELWAGRLCALRQHLLQAA